MACFFIRLELLDGNEVKINLDKVMTVAKTKSVGGDKKVLSIGLEDGTTLNYTEGVSIKDVNLAFSKFPC